jgi:hypothetical protein
VALQVGRGSIQHADWRLLQAHMMLLLSAEVHAGIISSTRIRTFLLQDLVDTWLPLSSLSSVSRCVWLFVFGLFRNPWTRSPPDCMYREVWDPWWNVLERQLYSFQSHAQQLAHLSPNNPRYSEAWHRRFVLSFLYHASSNIKNGYSQLKVLN